MTKRDLKKPVIVFYHERCSDGFGAAWAAWKKFGARAAYVPITHNEGIPEDLRGKEIYFVDIVYPKKEMERLMERNRRVTALDHHISSEKIVKMTSDHVYDVAHSGAILSWNYFHAGKRPPRLLRHVEDQDLWRFKVPHTKEIGALLELQPYDFKAWNAFARRLESAKGIAMCIAEGKLLLTYKNDIVRALADEAEEVRFCGVKAWVVNSPVFSSEVGGALVVRHKAVAIIWRYEHGDIRVSLRSDGKVNVAGLAERFGGGGHRGASGFSFPASHPLPWKRAGKS